jgi:hypothetical protein
MSIPNNYFEDYHTTTTVIKRLELPQLRTVNDTVRMLREIDGGSGLTEYFIRCLCKQDKIKTLQVGTKILIYWQSLIEYLQNQKKGV